MMPHQPGYELHVQDDAEDCDGLSVKVMFYNRALKRPLLEFVRQENLCIKEVLMADEYIRYEICCPLNQSWLVSEIEQVLTAASWSMNEARKMTALAVAQPITRWMLA